MIEPYSIAESSDDDNDYVQVISKNRAGPSHRTDTVDLGESIFERTVAGPSHRTDTVDLSASIFEVVNGNDVHSLPNRRALHPNKTGKVENVASQNHFFQTLPSITVAKEENIPNINDANTTNGVLDDADWNKKTTAINQFFGNGVTEQLPKTAVAATIPATLKTLANDWQDWEAWEDFEDIFGMTNDPQPGPSTSNFTNATTVTNAMTQNAAINKPNRNHQIHNNFDFFGQPPQLVRSVEVTGQVLPPAKHTTSLPLVPQMNGANLVTNTTHLNIQQQNQPGPSGMVHQLRQQMINMERTFEDAIPRWYPQQANHQIFPPHAANGMQAAQNIVTGHPVNNRRIGANMSIAPSATLKRRHTVAIPIKVIRSSKQYETLIEMGFLKKDVEAALRKFNLDLHEAIDYLSEPKRAAKRQKKEQNNCHQFTAEIPNQVSVLNGKLVFLLSRQQCSKNERIGSLGQTG